MDCQAQGRGTGGIPAVQEQLDEIQTQMAANLDLIMMQMAANQAELLQNQAANLAVINDSLDLIMIQIAANQAVIIDSIAALKTSLPVILRASLPVITINDPLRAAINARTTDTVQSFEADALQSRTAQTLYQVEEALPTEYALETSYPNPFNPTTTIRFDLPQADHVTLKVYDVQGREVATLVSGSLSAGRHRVAWDANGLASGTYFYQLRAGSFIQTRLMLLLK